VDQTEVIDDELNPDFKKTFSMYYYFERSQPLKFKILDHDGKDKYNLVGTVNTTLAKIVAAKNLQYQAQI
jgi:hypothetical protein